MGVESGGKVKIGEKKRRKPSKGSGKERVKRPSSKEEKEERIEKSEDEKVEERALKRVGIRSIGKA